MSDQIMVLAENIYRYYGNRCALNNVSFSAAKGEVTGFLGPNGAGKSTLMQIVSGVLAPSGGTVRISGNDIRKDAVAARARLGYLPELPPLYKDCDVNTYLDYCARLRNMTNGSLSGVIENIKEKCGLQDTGKKIIGSLSKGYQQRVGLAQAIIHSPEVLILDEPDSGLDPNQMVEMRNLIADLGNEHCVIFSTHILAEAARLCDRILIMQTGLIVLDKPIEYFDGQYALENTYVELTEKHPSTAAIAGPNDY